MLRRELVAMFMESPFYFDLMPRERLALLHKHEMKISGDCRSKSNHSFPKVICRHREKGAESDTMILIPVGSIPRQIIH